MVKTAEDEDPLGVITVLNIQTHSELKPLAQIRRFLHKACPSKDTRALLDQVRLAFILSLRSTVQVI